MADTNTIAETKTAKYQPIYCTVTRWCDPEFPTEVPVDYIQRGVTSCEECSEMCIGCKQKWHPNFIITSGMYSNCCMACFDLLLEGSPR